MRLLRIVALALALASFHCGDPSVELFTIAEPPGAAHAWSVALACAHAEPARGGDLVDVHWFAADLSRVHPALWGAWLPPDTIVLDLRHLADSVTIEHELLHHLLRGSVDGQAHPFVPFVMPCNVIPPLIGG